MMELPYTRDSLIQQMVSGLAPRFTLFWGHTAKQEGVVDKSCFSQWFPKAFVVDGVEYKTAEHYMMAGKARLFGDDEMLERIIAAHTPKEAKAFGRGVQNFDDERWQASCFDIVVEGNLAKFSQNPELASFLLATKEKVIVEAAPNDRIWGIGIGQKHADAENPEKWRGSNLLGFALMSVRDQLNDASA